VSTLYDSITRIARHEAAARGVASVGVVVEAFPAESSPLDHAVTVRLRDSGQVLPRVPIAVGAIGVAAMPAVDDLVVVVFLEGDTNAPVVVGRLYHPGRNPPPHRDGQLVLRLPPDAQPHEAAIDAEITVEEPRVRLTIGAGVEVELTRERAVIRIGELTATLDGAGGGQVSLAAGQSMLVMQQDGNVTMTSPGRLRLDANEIEINGNSSVRVFAAGVEIN